MTAPSQAVRVVLPRLGQAALRVLTRDGSSLEGRFSVEFERPLDEGGRSVHTRDFSADDVRMPLPAGRWTVRVESEGFADFVREIAVRPGETTSLGDVLLDRGLTLAGRIVDPEGRGIARSTVYVGKRSADSDDTGRFEIEHLCPGTVTLHAAAECHDGEVLAFELAEGSPPVVIVLRRSHESAAEPAVR